MAHSPSATGRARDCSPELKRLAAASLLLFCAGSATAQITLTQGTNFSIDAANDGRLAIDLLGAIWIVPASGGLAETLQFRAAVHSRLGPTRNSETITLGWLPGLGESH